MYEYKVRIDAILDGDTFDGTVDLGFHTYSKQRFRLLGYSAPEIRGKERPLGLIAKAKLEEFLIVGTDMFIHSEKTEKFGRWLADVRLDSGRSLSRILISRGYGLSWNGKGKRPRFYRSRYPLGRTSRKRG